MASWQGTGPFGVGWLGVLFVRGAGRVDLAEWAPAFTWAAGWPLFSTCLRLKWADDCFYIATSLGLLS